MAENTKITRNGLSFVKTKRGHQWRMHDHTGAVIAASSQYYASASAARRAANRAAVRMHKFAVKAGMVVMPAPEPQGSWLDEDDAHGNASAAVDTAREEVAPQPRKRFGLFGRRG